MSEDKDHVDVVLEDPKDDKKPDELVVEVEKTEPEVTKPQKVQDRKSTRLNSSH